MSLNQKSRFLTKLLRHDPQDLVINEFGYIQVEQLLLKLNITKGQLIEIVDTNNKQRFEFNIDKTLIRATQGHSINVNVDMSLVKLNDIERLYHGTSDKFIIDIKKQGLKPMSRLHVHLSDDVDTGINVGSRKSKNIALIQINAKQMLLDNVKIYKSSNNVYLTEYVDPKYFISIFYKEI